MDWCNRDESDVSYHAIIAPDGRIAQLVDWNLAAWSVGWAKSIDPRVVFASTKTVCKSNHASESIALAGAPPKRPTQQQVDMLVGLLVYRFVQLGWTKDDVWRIWGHDDCAIFDPKHVRAGQFGRKPDPQGSGWLPLEPIRRRVFELLAQRPG